MEKIILRFRIPLKTVRPTRNILLRFWRNIYISLVSGHELYQEGGSLDELLWRLLGNYAPTFVLSLQRHTNGLTQAGRQVYSTQQLSENKCELTQIFPCYLEGTLESRTMLRLSVSDAYATLTASIQYHCKDDKLVCPFFPNIDSCECCLKSVQI